MSEQSIAYEEVPGSRTTQQAIDQPQSERIAYEELQPGTEVQAGDQYRNTQGRWVEYSMDTSGVPIVGPTAMARRPHKITALQNERDELQTALRDSHAAHEFTMKQGLQACKERNEANAQIQQLLKTIADNADQFAEHTAILVKQRDGFDAEVQRLQEVVGNLYNEPTARQVQDMLRTWATELDWSAGCFDSAGREQIDTIQKTLVAVIERIETMLNPEGDVDGN